MSPREEKPGVESARARLRDLTARLLAGRGRQTLPDPTSEQAAADRALLIVDVQNDFVTGVLPVSGAARIVPVLNRYLQLFADGDFPIYLARDWHPPEGQHRTRGGDPSPLHCVRGTFGAAFPTELHVPVGSIVISKGTTPGEQGYSAFSGHHPGPVSLRASLESRRVRTVYVAGLGPGVLATVLDGCQLGFDTVLLIDAVRGIDGTSARLRRAIDGMCRAGARIEEFGDVEREIVTASETASDASSLP